MSTSRYTVYLPHYPRQVFAILFDNTINRQIYYWECDPEDPWVDPLELFTLNESRGPASKIYKKDKSFATIEEFKAWWTANYFEYLV
jgi:hypothetical protein